MIAPIVMDRAALNPPAAPLVGGASAALTPEALACVGLPTPYLAFDPTVVAARYLTMRALLPEVGVHYAVKCNPSPQVLDVLAGLGCGFEIASAPELDLVVAAGANPSEVLYSNPVKPPAHVAATFARGVRRFAVDSEGEVRKVAALAPGAAVYVRVVVDDAQSTFPLSRKFGTSIDQAGDLLLLARSLGLEADGVTFHVGSQCTDPTAWARAIDRCGVLLRRLHHHGVALRMLDIGGGFAAPYGTAVPTLADVAAGVRDALARLPHRPPVVVAEPGRYLVAESTVLVATVIGRVERDDGPWVFLDAGGYHGLMESVQTGGRWRFPLATDRADEATAPRLAFTVTGPTCDSSDTVLHDALLPATLDLGDRLLIGSAGAYTVGYATSFNGFPSPSVVDVSAA